MESTKPKKDNLLTKVQEKKGKILENISPKGDALEPDLAFWQESIQKLESQDFDSIDAAIEAIVDEALLRLGSSAPQGSEARNFLIDTFAFDEDLQSEIRKVLNINES